jgi:hypothetical protein
MMRAAFESLLQQSGSDTLNDELTKRGKTWEDVTTFAVVAVSGFRRLVCNAVLRDGSIIALPVAGTDYVPLFAEKEEPDARDEPD